MSSQSDLQLIKGIVTRLDAAKPANFAYTDEAYNNDEIEGVESFDLDADQNIPTDLLTDYHEFLLRKGVRAQGASIPRMGWNHFIGRFSFNLRKLTQKFLGFLDLFSAALAFNAAEYDPSARYKHGSTCYTIETINGIKVYTWHNRTSVSPDTIQGIPPSVSQHWETMQESTSFDSQFPYAAPGYKHKFTIADLTDSSFDTNYYYPVATDSFVANLDDEDIPVRVLIEAFTQGIPPYLTNEYRADLAVLSKFTGFGNSSKDVLLDQEYIRLSDGLILPPHNNPIGYTKLPKGKQAVIWLRGGQRYALWNSFGVDFTLHKTAWTNDLDDGIAPVYINRPWMITPATIQARLETPDAVNPDEAPPLKQVTGALPLPIELEGGETLRSLRKPGTYLALTAEIGNSLSDGPVQVPQLGVCDLVVKGDPAGLTMSVQQVIVRATGNEYTRILSGNVVAVDWYKSKSPTGLDIFGVEGLWALRIDDNGHLYVYYGEQDELPPLRIDFDPASGTFGHLLWEVDQ
jgi:hypothetical protein